MKKNFSSHTMLTIGLFLIAFTFSAYQASACGFQGLVAERKADGGIGGSIAGAKIVFTSETTNLVKTVIADGNGRYQVTLPKGRYHVKATKAGYESYSTGNGFFVVTCAQTFQTGNIFMKKQATCKLAGLVAEKGTFTPISGARITFRSEDGSIVKRVVSAANGRYSVELPQKRYKVTVTKAGFKPYTTGSGFVVVNCKGSTQTANFFLEKLELCPVKGLVAINGSTTPIANAIITFTSEDGSVVKRITSDANGRYSIDLPRDRYRVSVKARGYRPYTTGNGFVVVICKKPYQTSNYFLTRN